jgi:hypothetical protein
MRKNILLAGLFVLMSSFVINNCWSYDHYGWGYYHHGWRYYHHGWDYYRYYEPIFVPVPVYPPAYYNNVGPFHPCFALTLEVTNVLPVVDGKPYVMDVTYNGRLLYKNVLRGEHRLLRMRSCAYSLDARLVTVDVKDGDGNFIGTASRHFSVDSSRAETWNISLNDIQR